jgi:hypothetical protein
MQMLNHKNLGWMFSQMLGSLLLIATTANLTVAQTDLFSPTPVPPDDDQFNSLPTDGVIPQKTESSQQKADRAADQVRQYCQLRWRADPAYSKEYLEYRLDIKSDGRLRSITGTNDYSQVYFDKTRFLQPGKLISTATDQDYSLWVILGTDGVVRVSFAPPPATNLVNPLQDSSELVAEDTAKYFQRRWRGDANMTESLQYRLKVNRQGRIIAIKGQGTYSQQYLNRTRFAKVGTKVTRPSDKTQEIWLLMFSNGKVEALIVEGE